MSEVLILDYETLSNRPYNTAVLSFAAIICDWADVRFDNIEGLRAKAFYQVFDTLEQLEKLGYESNAETLRWWSEQGESARKVFTDPNRVSVNEHLPAFTKYCVDSGLTQKTTTLIRAPHFDFPIIDNIAQKTGWPIPFNHWKVRDVRSIVDACCGTDNGYIPGFKEKIANLGLHEHDARDDCIKDLLITKIAMTGDYDI